ncbi:MAG: DUF3365 domain-containing protein [Planctomycetes bacterium]|nr:DUF3365 domain-containing protein [Planctomycetota bacterium]
MSTIRVFFCVFAVSLAVIPGRAWGQAKSDSKDAALERTRKQVLMLDDIYKTTVVLITDKYVQDEQSFPAGSAAIALFDAIKKKGHHEVRLLDATGEPYDKKNVAKDDFEKEAIKQLKQGKATYEKVETRDDGRYLRMATSVPVVMKKCIMCHEVYNKAKEGEPIGALSYTLKVE